MVDGVTGGHLENAVLPVEMEQENARVPAPIPFRLVVEPIVQDPAQIQKLVTMDHALLMEVGVALDTGAGAVQNVGAALGSAGELVPIPLRQMDASVVLETTWR